MALRAAATARAAGVESGSAIVAPACTAVFGAVEGALPARAGATGVTISGAASGRRLTPPVAPVTGRVLEPALFEDVEGAAGVPGAGTKVPSACKINLAGPVASVDGEDGEAAGWAQPGECSNTKSAQKLASQLRLPLNPQF